MSQKRTFSQLTEDYLTQDTVQSLDLLQDMPSQSQRRRYAQKKSKRMLVAKPRVPRAIVSRGTPNGYYEIPVTIYHRLYFNSSTGVWPTDPITGVQTGSTGYNGFGLCSDLDVSYINFGNGGVVAQQVDNVPGFAQMAAVFDECKIARIHYEMWVAGTAGELGTTLKSAPNVFVVVDNNNADSPSNLNEILQYSPVHTVKGDIARTLKLTVYPKVRMSVGAGEQESSTSTTIAMVQSAGYMECAKPAVTHFGVRGYFETTSSLASAQLGYLCIKETQIRRYKVNK